MYYIQLGRKKPLGTQNTSGWGKWLKEERSYRPHLDLESEKKKWNSDAQRGAKHRNVTQT
jgi:hypothetical protein